MIFIIVQSKVQSTHYMSGSNPGKSSSITYQQVNSQKTLIYDLRSELSNLKSQFSRLISKPGDLASKSKADGKIITRSRYSCLGSQTDAQSHNSSVSQANLCTKTCQLPSRLALNRSDSNHENRNNPVQQKLISNNKKYYNLESASTSSKISWQEQDKSIIQQKKLQSQGNFSNIIKKPYEFATFYKKIHSTTHEPEQKFPATSRVLHKNSEINHINSQDQQKIKKLEQQNQQNIVKLGQLNKKVQDLEQNVNQTKKQLQNSVIQHGKKNEKLSKLQDTVRQLTQKLGRANEQTLEIGRQKIKQIQILKQGHLQQIKNQQKDFQKRMIIQKQNIELKTQGLLKQTKQSYESRLKQAFLQKQEVLQDLRLKNQRIQKQKSEITQVSKGKQMLQNLLRQKDCQITKKCETIKQLLVKQTQLQQQILEAKKKPEYKEIGINCEQKIEQNGPVLTIKNQSKANQPVLAMATGTILNQSQQSQNRTMQDKLNIYLNNIDKQSQKIKQQKSQLDRSQKIIEQCNRVITEKQLVVKNLLRDCKAMEKDLNENRRMRRQLEVLLEDSTSCLTKANLQKLSSKYQKLEV